MYDINSGDFTERAINIKSAGANWRKGYESARMSAIPHMLYKDEWERKRQLVIIRLLLHVWLTNDCHYYYRLISLVLDVIILKILLKHLTVDHPVPVVCAKQQA